ncbi:hypothetical protein Tco_0266719 [Tanacetum coccineum]
MAAVEVPQTLEYRGGHLNVALILEVENFTNWKKRFMCHIIGIETQFENIISNGPYIPIAAGQRKLQTQWTPKERKDANLDQRLKSLIMFVLPDDQMNSIINCLTAKSTWDDLILYHEGPFDVKESRVMDMKFVYTHLQIQRRNINHVKDSELASLFGKLKYEENLIDSIYETIEKSKSLVFATPLSTALFSAFIVQDFQDNPDDEEDTKSSHGYLKDLEEEYQARALLSKFKRFFKKGTQRDYWSKTSVPSYQSPFQPKLLYSSAHKPEPRQTKDFEAKYNKDEEEVSSDKINAKYKALMALANEERISVSKESANNDNLEVSITGSNKPKLSKAEDSTLSNHDTGKHPLPPLEKLTGAEPVFRPKTIKSILKLKSTFKAKTLKGITLNEPSSTPAKGNKSSLVFKTYSVPAGKLKNVKIEDDPPFDIVMKELNELK